MQRWYPTRSRRYNLQQLFRAISIDEEGGLYQRGHIRLPLSCKRYQLCKRDSWETRRYQSCLLQHPSCGGFLPATDKTLEGSYLHYSNEELRWIRSGKAVESDSSSPVNGRMYQNEQGHMKKSMSETLLDAFLIHYTHLDQTKISHPIELITSKT